MLKTFQHLYILMKYVFTSFPKEKCALSRAPPFSQVRAMSCTCQLATVLRRAHSAQIDGLSCYPRFAHIRSMCSRLCSQMLLGVSSCSLSPTTNCCRSSLRSRRRTPTVTPSARTSRRSLLRACVFSLVRFCEGWLELLRGRGRAVLPTFGQLCRSAQVESLR